MYKYSVIIPVYNAETTLVRCLTSILTQNYENAEIILIDDGSTDKSRILCEQFARDYPQMRYVHQRNSGVSAARNKGLSIATGKYILFVDSDDYVSDDYFTQIDRLIELYDTDLIIFSQYKCRAELVTENLYPTFFTDQIDDLYPELGNLICRKIINGPVSKVYKRELIDTYQVRFPVGVSIAEDRAFNIKYALHIQSLCVSNVPLYYVSLDNDTSLSRRKKELFSEQAQIVWDDINKAIAECELSAERKQYFIDALNFGECRVAYTYAKMYWQAGEKRSVRINKIKRLCKEINARHYSYPKTKYCRLITLPVRLEQAWLIDVMAWKLTH